MRSVSGQGMTGSFPVLSGVGLFDPRLFLEGDLEGFFSNPTDDMDRAGGVCEDDDSQFVFWKEGELTVKEGEGPSMGDNETAISNVGLI